MVNVNIIEYQVLTRLKKELSAELTYHNVAHTIDVIRECQAIARAEGITDEQTLTELHIAAIYHDAGFLFVYNGHEEMGCEMAREELPAFGIGAHSIDNICRLIMATKMPQSPDGLLQKIICDADLDYLGRDDFFLISSNLCKEVLAYKIANNKKEWEERQVHFLQSHTYFTQSSRQSRSPVQCAHIQKLVLDKNKKTDQV
ncbi:MAG: hypothetical protein JWR61_812 [Ferruginibacter sp.]|uniref:HD domain-containing protein n=1 Tax=Ferruginibacter sp. TaxID=1940288 RepID=UPI002657D18D|nr:HD domain-containing protein [Ferruginibacter sp.]MDB5275857.1 hypothetical protein [Ferruginibacter sp.]